METLIKLTLSYNFNLFINVYKLSLLLLDEGGVSQSYSLTQEIQLKGTMSWIKLFKVYQFSFTFKDAEFNIQNKYLRNYLRAKKRIICMISFFKLTKCLKTVIWNHQLVLKIPFKVMKLFFKTW